MQNNTSSSDRSYRRAIQRITLIEKLGTAIRVGWGWFIAPILILIACWLLGLPYVLTALGGIDPLLRTIRDWRK